MLNLRYQLGIYVLLLGFTPSFSAIAYDPLDCLKDISKVDKDIIVGLATKLCSGAWTAEPVKCYAQVSGVDTTIPRGIAIDLCAGSANAENTLKCYEKAGERGYDTLRGKRAESKSLVLHRSAEHGCDHHHAPWH
jgi:hypothetical protein